jgi:ribosomal protein L18E
VRGWRTAIAPALWLGPTDRSGSPTLPWPASRTAGRRSIVGLQSLRKLVILVRACIVRTVMDKLGQRQRHRPRPEPWRARRAIRHLNSQNEARVARTMVTARTRKTAAPVAAASFSADVVKKILELSTKCLPAEALQAGVGTAC